MSSNPSRGGHLVADEYLRFLVRQVEEEQLPIDLTLNVNGALVSGTLISKQEYFEGLAQNLTAAFSGPSSMRFYERGAELGREQMRAQGTPEEDLPTTEEIKSLAIGSMLERLVGYEASEGEEVSYIHLSRVKIGPPNARGSTAGEFWRGRLDAVDGFMFGTPNPWSDAS